MAQTTARGRPNEPHLRPSFAPIILTWMGEKAGDTVGAFGGNLIPALADSPDSDHAAGTFHRGGRWWLPRLIERFLPQVEVVSRIQTLEPLLAPPDGLILPVWAIGRSVDLQPEPLKEVVRRVAEHSVSSDFPMRAVASIRRTLASDPLATRLLSEESRVRVAGEEHLVDPDESGPPPIVGLLPERFTLAQLHAVTAGLLGRSPDDLESGSNFRRRTRELVHRRVLVEADSPVSSDERGGRPPRRFSFNAEAWKAWLLERCGGVIEDRHRDIGRGRDQAVTRNRFLASHGIPERLPERLRDPPGSDYRRNWISHSRFGAHDATPIWLQASQERDAAESTEERITRMERLIEQLYRQAQESRKSP